MGNKISAEEAKSKRLSLRLRRSRKHAEQEIKLLLLGAGESGKSTIFKQMRLLYGEGYSDSDRARLRPFLIGNVIDGALVALSAGDALGIELTDDSAKEAAKVIRGLDNTRSLTEDVASAITTLWDDEDFKRIYKERSTFQIQDTWSELVEKLRDFPEWGGAEWVPSMEDVILARVRTTGVVDEEFIVKDVKVRMLDVGGQRNERRKWIHCFENVTSVIFVASLSEYDQVLFEDATQNRLKESLSLFKETINSRWFKSSAIILFLNKVDLLEEKLVKRGIPLNESGLFPGAPSGKDLDMAIEWYTDEFEAQRSNPRKQQIFTHVTCATDTEQVDTVMRLTSEHVLRVNLNAANMLR
ncbi:Guanine nucleotide-binding protein subunit alpha [Hondaea fermentalgiana]|uniref:Guanine nucleotide-binding protein subunit alpha n=1 Tax=Hondaea fermentalgiana TaxID=2315210 RepID=A0A2R5G5E9_9STRA|nr:Guanine nucleotide-binding protein subunit alpha [Hondaea fermentalgiana]|eukprot:GBG26256.1 Guanine nucleotide-binding protein subunit alpha [Hondaea fermentalgiana]